MENVAVKEIEDQLTSILRTMMFGNIVGVVVDWDKETGEKYYGLRVVKRDARINPNKYQEYVIWFISDQEGNGPGCFQIQHIGEC